MVQCYEVQRGNTLLNLFSTWKEVSLRAPFLNPRIDLCKTKRKEKSALSVSSAFSHRRGGHFTFKRPRQGDKREKSAERPREFIDFIRFSFLRRYCWGFRGRKRGDKKGQQRAEFAESAFLRALIGCCHLHQGRPPRGRLWLFYAPPQARRRGAQGRERGKRDHITQGCGGRIPFFSVAVGFMLPRN